MRGTACGCADACANEVGLPIWSFKQDLTLVHARGYFCMRGCMRKPTQPDSAFCYACAGQGPVRARGTPVHAQMHAQAIMGDET